MKTINLADHKRNDFSQCGEDGITEKLFEIMKINSGFLVEFGAWDGVHLSNIRSLYERGGFKTMFIEADYDRYESLTQNVKWTDENILLNLAVKPATSGPGSLNHIFNQYVKDEQIALMSIDVDGEDFKIWQSLDTSRFRPAVVIIEFGAWKSPARLNALVKDFKDKNYNLVCVTGNFIFVDAKYGIKSTQNVHSLIRKSWSPEYIEHFGDTGVAEQIIEISE